MGSVSECYPWTMLNHEGKPRLAICASCPEASLIKLAKRPELIWKSPGLWGDVTRFCEVISFRIHFWWYPIAAPGHWSTIFWDRWSNGPTPQWTCRYGTYGTSIELYIENIYWIYYDSLWLVNNNDINWIYYDIMILWLVILWCQLNYYWIYWIYEDHWGPQPRCTTWPLETTATVSQLLNSDMSCHKVPKNDPLSDCGKPNHSSDDFEMIFLPSIYHLW